MRQIALTGDVVVVGEVVALCADAVGHKSKAHIRFQRSGYIRIESRAVKSDWGHEATDVGSQTSTE